MTWQDKIISIVGFSFSFTLLPQLNDCIFNNGSVNIFTALFTSLGLFALAITFATMNMKLSAASEALSGFIWFLIALFSW
jgi:hypothetical protein